MDKSSIFEKGKKRVFNSLGAKIFFFTAIFGLIIGLSAIAIGFTMYSRSADRFYSEKAQRIAEITAAMLDKKAAETAREDVYEIYEEYADKLTGPDEDIPEELYDKVSDKGTELSEGEDKESFDKIESVLRKVRDASADEVFVYYMTYDEDREWMIFVTDIKDEQDVQDEQESEMYFKPGSLWKVDRDTADMLTNPDRAGYTVYSTGSGMVVTKASPVYGENGEKLGYVGVDIMLDDVAGTKRLFLIKYCLAIGGLILLSSFLLLQILSRVIVHPVEKLEDAGQRFINRLGTELTNAPHFFADLNLHTGDEVEKLWLTMSDLEVNVAISMRRIKTMTTERERVEAELTVASQIQSSMLPCTFPAFPERSEFDLYAEMVPAKEVGGDLYDYFLTDEDHLAVVIADVSGKGIYAALFMVMTKQLLKSRTITDGADPVKVLTDVNALLLEDNEAQLFVTVFFGILTVSTGQFVYANAGHEYPAIRRKDGEFKIEKDIHTAPVAARKKTVFKSNEILLDPGDTLYLYTDGITEARDKDRKMFGRERLLLALNEMPDDTPREIDRRVRQRVKEFEKGNEPFDDCTTLCLKYFGGAFDSK